MIRTTIQTGLFRAVLATLGAAALVFSGTCNALPTQDSKSIFGGKYFPDQDLVCDADPGEIDITASTAASTISPTTFRMESARDESSMPIPHTCCEVPHDSGWSVAECEDGTHNCSCGEFFLDQKVEDDTAYGMANGDNVPSYCLNVTTTGGLETYNCVVNNGNPKENFVWWLVPADPATHSTFCDPTCTGPCGVATGTTDNPKPGEYPFGMVWEYSQYIKDGQVVLANFEGHGCHTGSFCLDDDITCEVKSAKLELQTTTTANFTLVEVDTVQTFNGNSTSGNVPTDFLSAAVDGERVVDPTEIDTTSISINDEPVMVNSFNAGTDRNGDGFNDLRANITQFSYQHALYPDGMCVPDPAKAVVFRGTFTDGRAWVGPTTVNVVCN